MKLYYAPDACSLAIHVILEEIGAPYDLRLVDMRKGEQHEPPFSTINPKQKVPVLQREDGRILTELPAIAFFLGQTFPEAELLPSDPDSLAKVLELMDYMVATVHMRGFTRIFRPAMFTPRPADEPAVREAGREVVARGMTLLDGELGGSDYLLGTLSIADFVLFVFARWAVKRADMALPPGLGRHFERMDARPAVRRALAAEGLD